MKRKRSDKREPKPRSGSGSVAESAGKKLTSYSVGALPILSRVIKRAKLEDFLRDKDFYGDMHRDAQRVKSEMTGLDDQAVVAEWYDKLQNLNHHTVPKWMIDGGLARLGQNKKLWKTMLKRPQRFRAAWAWFFLLFGGIVGSVISEKKGYQQYPLLKSFKPTFRMSLRRFLRI